MDIYGEKKNAVRTVTFLCTIMLVLTIADLFYRVVDFREEGKGSFMAAPKMTEESLISGSFMKDCEENVTNRFVNRENWITLKTYMDVAMLKKEINGVYLGKDRYLLEKHTRAEFSSEKVEKTLESMQQLIKEYPDTRFMPIPTKDCVLSEKLPAFAPYFDQRLLIEQMKNVLGNEHVIDVYPVLKAHEQEKIYFYTDSRWTGLGAYYGYTEFAKAYKLPAFNYLKQEPLKVTEEFKGNLYSEVNLPLKGEDILMFPRTLEKKYTITYDGNKTSHSFYAPDCLTGENKYDYFMDGTHALTIIERESFSQEELFVIKNSYGNCLIPFLARHYKRVYVVDLSCFDGSLINLMKECDTTGQMDVLVVYDCVDFVEHFSIR